MSRYSTEIFYHVCNDDTGAHFSIGPDRDSLGLVEVRSFDEKGEEHVGSGLMLEREAARQIADAIHNYLDQTEETDDKEGTDEDESSPIPTSPV